MTVVYPGAGQPAVEDITHEVAPGTLEVLLGPSGCGKTTLLKTVNRLVEPTGGRVLVDGRDTSGVEPNALRRRIGYVIQATGLFPHMSVARNIGVVPRLLGWPAERIAARVEEMLALVDLPQDYATRPPSRLSGGEAQRVGIARALAAEPDFLLMDEPFGALDAINRLRLQDELRAIHRRLGRTILFVTHDVDEALRIADRIAVMREGRLVQAATPLELLVSPADDFVAELVAADDLFRRLGLMTVGDVLGRVASPDAGGAASVHGSTVGGSPSSISTSTSTSTRSPAAPFDTVPPLDSGDDLRSALSALLRSGAEGLPVLGPTGEPAGMLTLAALQAAVRGDR